MTINPYDKGAMVRVSGPFIDVDTGNPVDPGSVSFNYKNPAGVITSLTYGQDAGLQKVSTGNYRVDIEADMSGMWHWRWFSTGNGQTADQGQFYVRPSYT